MNEGKPLESDLPANNYFSVRLQSVTTAFLDFSSARSRVHVFRLLVILAACTAACEWRRTEAFPSLSLSLSYIVLPHLRSFFVFIQRSTAVKKPRARRTRRADQSEQRRERCAVDGDELKRTKDN